MGYEDTAELISKDGLQPYLEDRRKVNRDLERRLATAEQQIVSLTSTLMESNKLLNAVSNELTTYKGMVGGAFFIISSLVTLIVLFKGWIFGGKG